MDRDAAAEIDLGEVLPGAVAPFPDGDVGDVRGVYAAAVFHRNGADHRSVGDKGDLEIQKIGGQIGQCGEGLVGEPFGLAGVAHAVHAPQLFLEEVVLRDRAVGGPGHGAQLFAGTVDDGHGETAGDVPALAGDPAQGVAALQLGLGGTVPDDRAGEPGDPAGLSGVIRLHAAAADALEDGAYLAPANNAAGRVLFGGDISVVAAAQNGGGEQDCGVHQDLLILQVQILLRVLPQLQGDHTGDPTHIGIGLDDAGIGTGADSAGRSAPGWRPGPHPAG